MIVIYCEKPSMMPILKNAIKEVCENFFLFSLLNPFQDDNELWMNIPKKLHFKHIPYTDKPEMQIRKNKIFHYSINGGDIKKSETIPHDVLTDNEFVYMGDNRGHCLFNFANMPVIFGTPSKNSEAFLTAMSEEYIKKDFMERKMFDFNNSNLKNAYINKRLDYLFYVNGLLVFNRTREETGISNFTKEYIMMLYKIQDGTYDINQWSGSGKYDNIYFDFSMMSKENYGFIHQTLSLKWLDKLHTHGMIKKINTSLIKTVKQDVLDLQQSVVITKKGELFLSLLHPKCNDPDLFSRILLWENLSYEEIDKKITHYINNFFGKQKRFNPS